MGKCFNQLTLNDRLTIEKILKTKKFTKQEIADTIGCKRVTIYREIKKGLVCGHDTNLNDIIFYAGDTAEKITRKNKSKQGAKLKAINDKELLAYISKKIEIDKYSPRATVQFIKKNKLQFEHCISDFTIYRYVKKGYFENLTMEKLPYEKIYKKKYKKMQKRASFGESIENRPEHVKYRREFGHWEMDSVEGSKGESKKSLLVLSERKTRKELIFVNEDMTANSVVKKIDYLEEKLGKYFNVIFKSFTVDNGKEFADVEGISKTKCPVTGHENEKRTELYYCHPFSPSERGTNENINKMIRKYVPKGTNFDDKPLEYFSYIQEEINNYPRQIFDFETSNERFLKELEKLEIPKDIYIFLFH